MPANISSNFSKICDGQNAQNGRATSVRTSTDGRKQRFHMGDCREQFRTTALFNLLCVRFDLLFDQLDYFLLRGVLGAGRARCCRNTMVMMMMMTCNRSVLLLPFIRHQSCSGALFPLPCPRKLMLTHALWGKSLARWSSLMYFERNRKISRFYSEHVADLLAEDFNVSPPRMFQVMIMPLMLL